MKTGSSGSAPEMSAQVVPPSSVRNTWPGCEPLPFQPENTTIAFLPSAGCVAIHGAARFGSTGLFGSGDFEVSVQFPASSVETQTLPFSVVAQIVPKTPPFGALWMLRMVSYAVPTRFTISSIRLAYR